MKLICSRKRARVINLHTHLVRFAFNFKLVFFVAMSPLNIKFFVVLFLSVLFQNTHNNHNFFLLFTQEFLGKHLLILIKYLCSSFPIHYIFIFVASEKYTKNKNFFFWKIIIRSSCLTRKKLVLDWKNFLLTTWNF